MVLARVDYHFVHWLVTTWVSAFVLMTVMLHVRG